jgi:two-component system, OmpR family, sensor kinase
VTSVFLDISKIEQVINNLITNAIKFSYNNSKITVNLSTKDNNVVIIVEDQGQGMPADELNKLFKPFSKASVKSTMDEKGTGLGLAILHKMIESHNGHISVESKLRIGSRFIISLPLT